MVVSGANLTSFAMPQTLKTKVFPVQKEGIIQLPLS
jgi:hypothetical protein